MTVINYFTVGLYVLRRPNDIVNYYFYEVTVPKLVIFAPLWPNKPEVKFTAAT